MSMRLSQAPTHGCPDDDGRGARRPVSSTSVSTRVSSDHRSDVDTRILRPSLGLLPHLPPPRPTPPRQTAPRFSTFAWTHTANLFRMSRFVYLLSKRCLSLTNVD